MGISMRLLYILYNSMLEHKPDTTNILNVELYNADRLIVGSYGVTSKHLAFFLLFFRVDPTQSEQNTHVVWNILINNTCFRFLCRFSLIVVGGVLNVTRLQKILPSETKFYIVKFSLMKRKIAVTRKMVVRMKNRWIRGAVS